MGLDLKTKTTSKISTVFRIAIFAHLLNEFGEKGDNLALNFGVSELKPEFRS